MHRREAWKTWEPIFKRIVKDELSKRKLGTVEIPEEQKPAAGTLKTRVEEDVEEETKEEAPAIVAKPLPPGGATPPETPPAPAKKHEAKKAHKKKSLKEKLREKKIKAKKKKK